MRSALMKKGLERAPHRSLFKAMGYTDEEIFRPLIGVVNSANEIIPGHIHFTIITEDVKVGISGNRCLWRHRDEPHWNEIFTGQP
jgi:dihydroxy-acid dehydratase